MTTPVVGLRRAVSRGTLRSRWVRPIAFGIVGGLATFQVIKAVSWLRDWPHVVDLITKADHEIYYQAALRIRAGGPVYPAFELAGPYHLNQLPELYPPPTLYGLIVPMSFLPAILWWAIPLAIIAAVVWYWRPSLVGWALILACLLPERTWVSIAAGNPVIWVTAAVALGTRWRPAFAFAVLKPTLAPFAILGVRSKGWWLVTVALALVSLALLPLWRDYLTVLGNLRDPGLLYSLDNVPLVLIPLLAWWSRQASPSRRSYLWSFLAVPI
jgi:hypothetical protein